MFEWIKRIYGIVTSGGLGRIFVSPPKIEISRLACYTPERIRLALGGDIAESIGARYE
jgi:hypothetical protein